MPSFHPGDIVSEKDGRHMGKVTLIHGDKIYVRWFGNNWQSEYDCDELVLEQRARTTTKGRPNTIMPSPKSMLNEYIFKDEV